MPLLADPESTQRIVLSCDEDKTPQPAFFYRPLSYRKWATLQSLMDNLKNETGDNAIQKQFIALADGIVGWENVIDPETGDLLAFDPQRMPDVITMTEAQELLMKRLRFAIPSVDDKKKLPSQSESGTEDSAKGAKVP